jgi:hypothetical protein
MDEPLTNLDRAQDVVPRRGRFRSGDPIRPRINAGRAVLFDVDSGPQGRLPLATH